MNDGIRVFRGILYACALSLPFWLVMLWFVL